MSLKSLLLCSDEKIVRVLRRTLGDLDIEVELCGDADSAIRRLTRKRFEAIIVDCCEKAATDVLRSSRHASCNKRAVTVAIVDPATGLRSIFDLGAHFVLYKPVTSERARSSFRAARALMNRERRRNVRVPVHIPVSIEPTAGSTMRVTTSDLSEGGMSVKLPRRMKPNGQCWVSFALPGTDNALNLKAEFAWEGNLAQAGLRFVRLSADESRYLQEWLKRNSPEPELSDPPVRCQLTDLSLGGCYLEISSPFPVATRVSLAMKVSGLEVRTEGVVRVMHPERGMGVEFAQATADHKARLEKFLEVLTQNRELLPELVVEPEGFDVAPPLCQVPSQEGLEDPLLALFRERGSLPVETFLAELSKQRGVTAPVSA